MEKSTFSGWKIDVIVGGPPCQGFSAAGARPISNEPYIYGCLMPLHENARVQGLWGLLVHLQF